MFKTRALSSLKSIFPPIHQPLPLNKRESQKLLNALTSSFRSHLEKEHGPSAGLPPAPSLSYLPDTPSRPTDRHLGAILNNPLLRDSRNDAITTPKSPTETGLDPKEVFERAVAKGLMTIPRAHGFLLRVHEEICNSTAVSVSQEMAQSGAGLMVVQWLRASGEERSLSFLTNMKFTGILVKFMAAEGLDELAWSWLQRLLLETRTQPSGVTSRASSRAHVNAPRVLFTALVLANPEAVELDGAYSAVVRGDALFQTHMPAPSLVRPAWMQVAWQTTSTSWRHKVPGAELFDSFLAVGEHLWDHELVSAHLDLYHPTSPSSVRAVRYILDEDAWRTKLSYPLEQPKKYEAPRVGFVKRLHLLSVDTAMHLTKTGEFELAQTVLGRINTALGVFKTKAGLNMQWS